MTTLQLDDASFDEIRKLIHAKFGICLSPQKRSMVLGRLRRVILQRNFSDFKSYLVALKNDNSGDLVDELANKISTNHTHFWREPNHFKIFSEEVIPWVQSLGQKDLRLWCAASATGEEPWTLAMLLRQKLGTSYKQWKAGLIATDISKPALEKAQTGIYDDDQVNPLPKELCQIGFQQHANDTWRIRDELRRDTLFRRFNLMDDRFPFRQKFHCIFIRNVMIYFDQETRTKLVSQLCKNLVAGGWLFIGHSESINRDHPELEYLYPAAYRKKSS